jgi:hypothetical protein
MDNIIFPLNLRIAKQYFLKSNFVIYFFSLYQTILLRKSPLLLLCTNSAYLVAGSQSCTVACSNVLARTWQVHRDQTQKKLKTKATIQRGQLIRRQQSIKYIQWDKSTNWE